MDLLFHQVWYNRHQITRQKIERGQTKIVEKKVMHGAWKVLWSFEFTLHKRLVDDHLGGDVGEFAPLPGLHLLSHRLKAPLHSIDSNRNAVDERERLRVFCEDGREHACDNVSEFRML